jgi:protein-disulfide isomerase
LSRTRLLAGLLVLALTVGCKAQQNGFDTQLERRIEIAVRTQYQLPPDVDVSIGARKPSQFSGYDTLPVTLAKEGKTQEIDFLISTDSTKLAHMDSFDLTKDPASTIGIEDRPIRGNAAAKVTVINFDDLECPYCARMHAELFPATFDHYKGKVRFIYKDYPLTELHPWAMHAAVNANCLASQSGSAYWAYVDYLHTHDDEITGPALNLQKSNEALDRIARQEGTLAKVDAGHLDACIAKQDETHVQASLKEAGTLELQGAPALFVNGERIDGAVPQPQLWAVIDRALRAAGEEPPPSPPVPAQASQAVK